jgi:hypothetical protein
LVLAIVKTTHCCWNVVVWVVFAVTKGEFLDFWVSGLSRGAFLPREYVVPGGVDAPSVVVRIKLEKK